MNDAFFFIGILLLFFIVWVASGGPARPISFEGPYLHPITTTGTTAQAYGDPNAYGPINSTISLSPGGINVGAGTRTSSARSGSVTIARNTSGVSPSDPEKEYVSLQTSALSGGSVSLAGWRLMNAETGKSAAIPAATAVAETGRVNELQAVTLAPGEEAIVVSGRSPVGISFRENICAGYLEDRQDFAPPLPSSCPTPHQEFSRFYRDSNDAAYDACDHYTLTLPYCAVNVEVPNDVPSSCERFIDDVLNYNGCVALHKNDSDFAGRTWRLFLGSRTELWDRSHGTILLLDAEGKVVDSFSY